MQCYVYICHNYRCYINTHVLFIIVPSTVTGLSLQHRVVSSNPAILISWTRPSSERPVLHYEVQYRINGTDSWSILSPNPNTTSTTLQSLQLDTAYEVRVRAVSDIGIGGWSIIVSGDTHSSK